MADTFTSLLRLVLQETGGNQNVWGDINNASAIDLLEDAIAARLSLDVTPATDPVTLTTSNGADDQARNAVIALTGAPGGTRDIIVPSTAKLYIISNETADVMTIKTVANAGVGVRAGTRIAVMVDPVADDVFEIGFIPTASETEAGIIQIATQVETDAGVDDTKAITPAKYEGRASSEILSGHIRRATAAEAEADVAIEDTAALTTVKLVGRTSTEDRLGVIELATQAEVDAGTDTERAITPATLAGGAFAGDFAGCSIFNTSFFIAGHTSGLVAGNVPTGNGGPGDLGETACPFNAEMVDTGLAQFGTQFHDNAVNNTRITIPAGVNFVRLRGSCVWDQTPGFAAVGETSDPNNSGTGLQHIQIRKNGNSFLSFTPDATGVRGTGTQYIPWETQNPNLQESGMNVASVVVPVEEDDYFEFMAFTQGSDEANHRLRSGTVFELEVLD